jgi:hypothetical protein
MRDKLRLTAKSGRLQQLQSSESGCIQETAEVYHAGSGAEHKICAVSDDISHRRERIDGTYKTPVTGRQAPLKIPP